MSSPCTEGVLIGRFKLNQFHKKYATDWAPAQYCLYKQVVFIYKNSSEQILLLLNSFLNFPFPR